MKTGEAFPDYISTGSKSKLRDYASSAGTKHARGFFLLILFIAVLGILSIRLVHLQIINGSYYRELSDSNRIRTQAIHAPRGIIFDRNGTPLVFNVPGFRKKEKDRTILISREKALGLIAQGEQGLEVDELRNYPYGEVLSHTLGYIGQISQIELGEKDFSNYHGGDLIGKMGIEKEYEHSLTGIDGKRLFEVNSNGKEIRTLGSTDPMPGQNITLTIDMNLQKAAFNAMKSVVKGAVVVTNKQGEVLALVSKPSFDPNLFTLDETYKTPSDAAYRSISTILSDSNNQPLLNRAIGGVYPPGSTFKLITASSGLEDKLIDENYKVEDTGIFSVGAFSFANWYFTQYGKTEGAVNVVKAIQRSNDIFFYKLAELIGVDKLSEMAKKFGLGSKLGIDLDGEEAGTVPTSSWKKEYIKEPWYLGDTYHYGIGQGYLLTTPLQVNMWTSVIANGGILYEPHLLKNQSAKIKNQNFLSSKTVDLIRQGMIESCSTGGVAWPLFEFKIQNSKFKIDGKNFLEVPESTSSGSMKGYRQVTIACKTGTAQHGGEQTLPHSWITLFAPAYDPQVIVTVLSESSGEGSNIAGPIAKKILEEWFSK